jgi:hypothetical protein
LYDWVLGLGGDSPCHQPSAISQSKGQKDRCSRHQKADISIAIRQVASFRLLIRRSSVSLNPQAARSNPSTASPERGCAALHFHEQPIRIIRWRHETNSFTETPRSRLALGRCRSGRIQSSRMAFRSGRRSDILTR